MRNTIDNCKGKVIVIDRRKKFKINISYICNYLNIPPEFCHR